MTSRLPAALLGLYVVFVVYGSLFPFHFEYDPDALDRVLHPSPRRVSRTDVVANVLLGAPIGALMTWSGVAGRAAAVRVVSVALVAVVLGSAVELGQAFVPGRVSSRLDVVAQVIGSLVGLLVAHRVLARSQGPLWPRLAIPRSRRPLLVGLLALAAVLAADALYPFVVTLDVSTVWDNVKSGQWRPFATLARDFWPDVLVEKLLAYAVLAAVARALLLDARPPGAAGLLAWAGATGFAVLLEGAKPLIEGRAPNVDGVGLAALGALVGVTAGPALARAPAVRAHPHAWLVGAAVALLAYEELTPFTWIASAAALPERMARVEWVPFAAYYGANLQSALFDFGKKIVLGAAVGAAMRYASPRPRLALVLVVAALLEAAQILQPVHTPSTTDVLTLYFGALVGSYLVDRGAT